MPIGLVRPCTAGHRHRHDSLTPVAAPNRNRPPLKRSHHNLVLHLYRLERDQQEPPALGALDGPPSLAFRQPAFEQQLAHAQVVMRVQQAEVAAGHAKLARGELRVAALPQFVGQDPRWRRRDAKFIRPNFRPQKMNAQQTLSALTAPVASTRS